MTILISGLLTLISGVVFVVSLAASFNSESDSQMRIGDTFAHVNPGTSDDPNQPNRPFVSLYVVEEITGGKVRCRWITVLIDGVKLEYDVWSPLKDFGTYDTKLGRRKPAALVPEEHP